MNTRNRQAGCAETGGGSAWLPPAEEWDFRRIAERESRLACCWEYARSARSVRADVRAWLEGPGEHTALAWYLWHGGPDFPEPWARREEHPNVEGVDFRYWAAVNVYPMAERKALLRKEIEAAVRENRDVWEIIDGWLWDESYVVLVDFKRFGSETIVRELESWARGEAKRFPRPPRAKGAEPPFDCLKWLAAFRLEEARLAANVGFDGAQKALRDYQRKHPVKDGIPVLPIYASQGAWSKAKGDAKRLLRLLEEDPQGFEKQILF